MTTINQWDFEPNMKGNTYLRAPSVKGKLLKQYGRARRAWMAGRAEMVGMA